MTLLHVERVGAGPRILFVHGSMNHGSGPFEPLGVLADAYTLEFIDRRGFGASVARPGGADFEADADDLVDLLGDGAHVVGHSSGGVVALLASARRPERVRSLTVIEPAFLSLAADDPSVVALRRGLEGLFPAPVDMMPERWIGAFLSGLGSLVPDELPVPPAELADVKASMGERAIWEAAADLEPIRSARVPLLAIRGDWSPDPAAGAVAGAAFRAVIARLVSTLDAKELVAPGATHAPQVERPDLVVPAVRAHVAAAETTASAA